jgi:hypothetical protein
MFGQEPIPVRIHSVDYVDEFSESAFIHLDDKLRINDLSDYILRSRLPEMTEIEVIFTKPIPGATGDFFIKTYNYSRGKAKLAVRCGACNKLHHLILYPG